jgi:hypothetical protein
LASSPPLSVKPRALSKVRAAKDSDIANVIACLKQFGPDGKKT